MHEDMFEQGVIRLGGTFVNCPSLDFTADSEVLIRDTFGNELLLKREQWLELKKKESRTPETGIHYMQTTEGRGITLNFSDQKKVTIADQFNERVALSRKEWAQMKNLFF